MSMKKKACLLLAAILFVAGALTGCVQAIRKGSMFEADNEIFTYQRIDPEKTQITVARIGNIGVEKVCIEFEAQNPDIQIIYLDITGGNNAYAPLTDWIKNGDLPDVVVTAGGFFDKELTTQYFENLSQHPVVQNYETAALQRTATDANVYWLPGPSEVSAMMYNKTLFEKYGWEVPVTFNEFVALCDKIREDTNGKIEPWNPNAKYSNELITAMEAFTYEELFGGIENRSWYNKFVEGNATFTGHMEPYVEALQTLIDHDILREEHFSYSATTRGKEFEAGNIAMINGNIYDADNDNFDFGYMPFPTTAGELGYLCDRYSCYIGVSAMEHTEAEDDAINRLLAYFSSPEGQKAYIGNSLKISNVKNVSIAQSDEIESLQSAIDKGHMFSILEFRSTEGGSSRANLHGIAEKMISGEMTGAECIAEVDKRQSAAPASTPEIAPETVAVAAEDFTILETSFLIADMYREATGADIALIANNEAYRGNLMRIYAGDITPAFITVLKPRSFANESTLVKVSMTGSQLMDALNHPAGNGETANCIYAFSGLKCKVAPWNELGTKYLSVQLADGSTIENDTLYTVAVWDGTVGEDYMTEILESYGGAWEELMTEKLKADGTIAPANDGRITLVWK